MRSLRLHVVEVSKEPRRVDWGPLVDTGGAALLAPRLAWVSAGAAWPLPSPTKTSEVV